MSLLTGVTMEVRPPEDGFPALTPEEFAALPHDDLGPALVGTSWTFVGLALVFICLRVYCKLTRRRMLWWDDHFLIVSWVREPLSVNPSQNKLTILAPISSINSPRNSKRHPRLRKAHLGHSPRKLPLQDAHDNQHLRNLRHRRHCLEQDLIRHYATANKPGVDVGSSVVHHRVDEHFARAERAVYMDTVHAY